MSSFTDRLNELLHKPVRTPEDARRAERAAVALGELLRAERKAERVLAGESTDDRPARAGESLAGQTLQNAAEAVLEEAGRPLHAKELGQRIKARGWKHPRGKPSRPDQIVYQLAARLPRHQRFRRVAPNTFGLTKWADAPPKLPRRPQVGLFRGPGGDVARQIGESPNEPAAADSWR